MYLGINLSKVSESLVPNINDFHNYKNRFICLERIVHCTDQSITILLCFVFFALFNKLHQRNLAY